MTLAVSAVCNAQVENNEVNKKDNAALNTLSTIFRYKSVAVPNPGWEDLTLKEQNWYYLTAGTSGRDIMWDQNYRYNLKIRKALEHIYQNYKGDKSTEDWANFETYKKEFGFQTESTITIMRNPA
jgi:dipeptidyl-peptidase-3